MAAIRFKDLKNQEHDLPEGKKFEFRPSVHALITKGDKILLVKAAFHDFWDLPGGRIDLGEHPFDSLKREVWEETGYKILSHEETPFDFRSGFICYKEFDKYYQSIINIFKVKIDDSIQVTNHIDPKEISTVKWVSLNDLSNHPVNPAFIKAVKKLKEQ